jgi:hypothetical protein
MHRRSSVCSLIIDGIVSHESRRSKVHDPLRYTEPIKWRDPNGGDASASSVERGLSRIRASADNNDTGPDERCRKASKAASQRRWLRKSETESYRAQTIRRARVAGLCDTPHSGRESLPIVEEGNRGGAVRIVAG